MDSYQTFNPGAGIPSLHDPSAGEPGFTKMQRAKGIQRAAVAQELEAEYKAQLGLVIETCLKGSAHTQIVINGNIFQ